MRRQGKDHLTPQKREQARKTLSGSFRGSAVLSAPQPRLLASRTEKEQVVAVVSHTVGGNLLQRPWESNTTRGSSSAVGPVGWPLPIQPGADEEKGKPRELTTRHCLGPSSRASVWPSTFQRLLVLV